MPRASKTNVSRGGIQIDASPVAAVAEGVLITSLVGSALPYALEYSLARDTLYSSGAELRR